MIQIKNIIKDAVTDGENVIGSKIDHRDRLVIAQEVKNILQERGIYADVFVGDIEINEYY